MDTDPLDQVEAEWRAVRLVEGAHATFHMKPTPKAAAALISAVETWQAIHGEGE